MLTGSYLGVLSDSRRVAVPKKFINEIGENPVVAKWYEDCLVLVNANFLKDLIAKLTGEKQIVNLGVRDIERFIIGSSFEVEPDDQGRIIIPEILAKYAFLEKDVVFVGLLDRVEIWSNKTWEEKSSEFAKTTKSYIEGLSK
jgi:MraZ protein